MVLGCRDGRLDFYTLGGDIQGSATVAPNQWFQVVLTRSPAGIVSGYLNRAKQWSFDDSASGLGLIDSLDMLIFFRDNGTGGSTSGEDSAGAVARIRRWDNALNATEVAQLNREPQLINLSPTKGPAGTVVHVSGSGFSPGETVDLSLLDKTGPTTTTIALGTATANSLGSFTADVTIPAGASAEGTDYIQTTGRRSSLVAKRAFDIN